ncbi:MAG: aquaporin family protein [Gemmatimonadetes bacterium]|nr:aquaporin family protein [Gemmatimonadota bacterium]
MIKYVTEFLGTLFLVLTIGLVVIGPGADAGAADQLILMVMVYGRHVSGAHYNPAVTLALAMRGKLPGERGGAHMVSQVLGAIVATVMVVMTGQTFAPVPGASVTPVAALLVEVVFTFALALVVLNVATHPATRGNSYYGLAIGMTVGAAAFAGGPISGGAFNPAVGIGPTLVNALLQGGSFASLWYYLVGPRGRPWPPWCSSRRKTPPEPADHRPAGPPRARPFPSPR